MKKLILIFTSIFLSFSNAFAQQYEISREADSPFSFSIRGVELNEGSSLDRESILLNDPSSPVQITSHSMNITYVDRGFRFAASTSMSVDQPITGVQLRTIQYDAFGQHMQNLGNTEIKDFNLGNATVSAEWRAREAYISRFLTSVTYVARVRLEDGTQWVYDEDELIAALRSLNLEQKIGEDSDLE
ncbi:hypothetical protein [Rhodohalobacter halophilus]|uniref:hypothetical protein n=1 Tax=Rhodohalobacter halophilus TaxID=1812810 RepID=UPI00083FC602|nr:hypothetical protein [Rhodohalobacter halophilus]